MASNASINEEENEEDDESFAYRNAYKDPYEVLKVSGLSNFGNRTEDGDREEE